MKEIKAGEVWCPMGRISIQHGSDRPQLDVLKCGAFNRVILYAPGSQDQGQQSYPSRCLGEGCACWEWGFFSRLGLVPAKLRRGRCGFTSPGTRLLPVATMLAGAAILLAFLYPRMVQ